jgi:transposase
MEVLHGRAVGMDVSKGDAKVCVRVAGGRRRKTVSTVTTWGAMTGQVLALRDHLVEQDVTCIVMEATGDYWKQFYYLLEDGPWELILANAGQVKNLPGRKSDVSDAAWLADLGAHGLVRASFVPPEPIRRLRDLTRTRTALGRDRTRELNRLEGLLEDAGIKLGVVSSKTLNVSTRAMIEALIAGQRDPEVLADLAKTRLRAKIPQLREALVGRFNDHHAFLADLHLQVMDRLTEAIEELTERIDAEMRPYAAFHALVCSIPGIAAGVADVIVAETGADMSRFPTARHLANWAGTVPGMDSSAGRVRSHKIRKGNPHLKAALGMAAIAVTRTDTRLGAKYWRIASRRGKPKAQVAIMRNLLILVHAMTTTGALYDDLGSDYYARRDPARIKRRALTQLQELGYQVTLTALKDPETVPT